MGTFRDFFFGSNIAVWEEAIAQVLQNIEDQRQSSLNSVYLSTGLLSDLNDHFANLLKTKPDPSWNVEVFREQLQELMQAYMMFSSSRRGVTQSVASVTQIPPILRSIRLLQRWLLGFQYLPNRTFRRLDGFICSTIDGPYVLDDTNNLLIVTINGHKKKIFLPTGTVTNVEIIGALNAPITGLVGAIATPFGQRFCIDLTELSPTATLRIEEPSTADTPLGLDNFQRGNAAAPGGSTGLLPFEWKFDELPTGSVSNPTSFDGAIFGTTVVYPGTGTLSSAGTTVTGTGTKFLTELKAADAILAGTQRRFIVKIVSDTSLITNTAFSPVLAGSAFSYERGTAAVRGTVDSPFIGLVSPIFLTNGGFENDFDEWDQSEGEDFFIETVKVHTGTKALAVVTRNEQKNGQLIPVSNTIKTAKKHVPFGCTPSLKLFYQAETPGEVFTKGAGGQTYRWLTSNAIFGFTDKQDSEDPILTDSDTPTLRLDDTSVDFIAQGIKIGMAIHAEDTVNSFLFDGIIKGVSTHTLFIDQFRNGPDGDSANPAISGPNSLGTVKYTSSSMQDTSKNFSTLGVNATGPNPDNRDKIRIDETVTQFGVKISQKQVVRDIISITTTTNPNDTINVGNWGGSQTPVTENLPLALSSPYFIYRRPADGVAYSIWQNLEEVPNFAAQAAKISAKFRFDIRYFNAEDELIFIDSSGDIRPDPSSLYSEFETVSVPPLGAKFAQVALTVAPDDSGTRDGNGTIKSDGVTVTGLGTIFTQQLAIGNLLFADNQARKILQINSDTELILETPFAPDLGPGTTFEIQTFTAIHSGIGALATIDDVEWRCVEDRITTELHVAVDSKMQKVIFKDNSTRAFGTINYIGQPADGDSVTIGSQTFEFDLGSFASGTLTYTGQPVDGDTFTLDNTVFEFDSDCTVAPGHIGVFIAGTDDATFTNLRDTVLSYKSSIVNAVINTVANTIIFTAITPGPMGDTISFTKVSAAFTLTGAGTLTGGNAPSVSPGNIPVPIGGNEDATFTSLTGLINTQSSVAFASIDTGTNTVTVTAKVFGTEGNEIVFTDVTSGNFSITPTNGFLSGGTGPRAAGFLVYTGNPADGDNIVIGNYTFEFDTDGKICSHATPIAISGTIFTTWQTFVDVANSTGVAILQHDSANNRIDVFAPQVGTSGNTINFSQSFSAAISEFFPQNGDTTPSTASATNSVVREFTNTLTSYMVIGQTIFAINALTSQTDTGTPMSMTLNVPSDVPKGLGVFVIFTTRAISGGVASVTDSKGNTYTQDIVETGGTSEKTYVFTSKQGSAIRLDDDLIAATPDSITVALSGGNTFTGLAVTILTTDGVCTLDSGISAVSTAVTGAPSVGPTPSPNNSGEFVLAALGSNGPATDIFTPGAGYTVVGRAGTAVAANQVTINPIYKVKASSHLDGGTDTFASDPQRVTCDEITTYLNTRLVGVTASCEETGDFPNGRLVLSSQNPGPQSCILIGNGSANVVLGFEDAKGECFMPEELRPAWQVTVGGGGGDVIFSTRAFPEAQKFFGTNWRARVWAISNGLTAKAHLLLFFDGVAHINDFSLFSLAGSGTITTLGTNVTGAGTFFTTELKVGDELLVNGQSRFIVTINSNISLVVNSAYTPDILVPSPYAFRRLAPSDGTGTITTVGTAVTGAGTKFTKEIAVGDIILANSGGIDQARLVTNITDDMNLTIKSAFSPNISTPTAFRIQHFVSMHPGDFLFSPTIDIFTQDNREFRELELEVIFVGVTTGNKISISDPYLINEINQSLHLSDNTVPRNKQRQYKLFRMAIANPDVFTDIEAGLVGLTHFVERESIVLSSMDFTDLDNQNVFPKSEVLFRAGLKAHGSLIYTGQPADGDTVTIGNSTFEFDNNSSVAVGHILVTIGATDDATFENFVNAVIAASSLATASQDKPRKTVTIEALLEGQAGNEIIFAESSSVISLDPITGALVGGIEPVVYTRDIDYAIRDDQGQVIRLGSGAIPEPSPPDLSISYSFFPGDIPINKDLPRQIKPVGVKLEPDLTCLFFFYGRKADFDAGISLNFTTVERAPLRFSYIKPVIRGKYAQVVQFDPGTKIATLDFSAINKLKTGTGTITTLGTAVTGSGTLFTQELTVGDRIIANSQVRLVTAITSDTSLTINLAFSPDILVATAFKYQTAGDDSEAILIKDGVSIPDDITGWSFISDTEILLASSLISATSVFEFEYFVKFQFTSSAIAIADTTSDYVLLPYSYGITNPEEDKEDIEKVLLPNELRIAELSVPAIQDQSLAEMTKTFGGVTEEIADDLWRFIDDTHVEILAGTFNELAIFTLTYKSSVVSFVSPVIEEFEFATSSDNITYTAFMPFKPGDIKQLDNFVKFRVTVHGDFDVDDYRLRAFSGIINDATINVGGFGLSPFGRFPFGDGGVCVSELATALTGTLTMTGSLSTVVTPPAAADKGWVGGGSDSTLDSGGGGGFDKQSFDGFVYTTVADAQVKTPEAFTAKQLTGRLSPSTPLAGGETLTLTLNVNGVNSGLSMTFTSASLVALGVGSVAVADGDLIFLQASFGGGLASADLIGFYLGYEV